MTQSAEYRRLVRLAAGYNRKAERLGRRGRVTADDLMVVAVTHPNCRYCGVSLEPGHGSFDHIVALDRGGSNDFTNIARCCMSCQRRKFTKTEAEFAAHQALVVSCAVCGRSFHPRWAEYQRGDARTCSRSCAGRKGRWSSTSERSMPVVDALVGRLNTATPPSLTPRPTSKPT